MLGGTCHREYRGGRPDAPPQDHCTHALLAENISCRQLPGSAEASLWLGIASAYSPLVLQRLDGLIYLWILTSNYRNFPPPPSSKYKKGARPGVASLSCAFVLQRVEVERHPGVNIPFPHLDFCVQDPRLIEAIRLNGPKAKEWGWAGHMEAAISKAAGISFQKSLERRQSFIAS